MTFAHVATGFFICVAMFFGLLVILLTRKRKAIETYLKQYHTEVFLFMYSQPNEKYDDEYADAYFDKLIKTEFIKLSDENITALVSEYKILRASCFILAAVLFLTVVSLH